MDKDKIADLIAATYAQDHPAMGKILDTCYKEELTELQERMRGLAAMIDFVLSLWYEDVK